MVCRPGQDNVLPLTPIPRIALGVFFVLLDFLVLVLDGWPIRGGLRCRECRARYSAADLFCPNCGRWPRTWIAFPVFVLRLIAWGFGRVFARFHASPR